MAIPACLPGISFRDIADLNLLVPVKNKKDWALGQGILLFLRAKGDYFSLPLHVNIMLPAGTHEH